MALNPRFNISIQFEEGQEEWVKIMKQEFENRLIHGKYDYFMIDEETEGNMIVYFCPRTYVSEKEFVESFRKNVLEPARKATGLKQA